MRDYFDGKSFSLFKFSKHGSFAFQRQASTLTYEKKKTDRIGEFTQGMNLSHIGVKGLY